MLSRVADFTIRIYLFITILKYLFLSNSSTLSLSLSPFSLSQNIFSSYLIALPHYYYYYYYYCYYHYYLLSLSFLLSHFYYYYYHYYLLSLSFLLSHFLNLDENNLSNTGGQIDILPLRVTRKPCQEDLLLFSPKEMDSLETSDEVCPSVRPFVFLSV